ncbi:hypothetical protein CAC42_7657 [Sphaceloma murrayae]|uniref:Uncharacterized protein n=1 Tax=Sphaceloma murrayae TaxID=2082308 RepID=A0A2K1QT94_9PEZI|nr:hypothetical protein CAC42_7657 [Sphaceloma murrayae]
MSVVVPSMTSPRQLPLGSASDVATSSPTKGYRPPSTLAERTFAEGQRSSPQKTQREEPRGAYRAQSIRLIKEVDGDVEGFLEEVELKRRQCDEAVHRYIKQKDREVKMHERDTRVKYRNAALERQSGRSSPASSRSSRAAATNGHAHAAQDSVLEDTEAATNRQGVLQARSQPHVADNGLKDPQVARDREADLLGLFTPTFLPLLSTKPAHQQSSSVPASLSALTRPSALSSIRAPFEQTLHRANSDPVDEKDVKQTRIRLEQRTSSSGSESKSLVSVLKSPAANARVPTRKRVSLVVGDDIVAPSDNINALYSPDDDQQFDHAEHVERIDMAEPRLNPRIPEKHSDSDGRTSPPTKLGQEMEDRDRVEKTTEAALSLTKSPSPVSGISSALATERKSSLKSKPAPMPKVISRPEPDVFNFSDNELRGEQADRPPSDVEDASDISPVRSPAPPTDIRRPPPPIIQTPPARAADIPARSVSKLHTSSLSSSQPATPGFSRPSVKDDPMFPLGADVSDPEIEQNEVYGSLGASLSLKASSLGESFMERNAEELRKSGKRRTSQTSQ